MVGVWSLRIPEAATTPDDSQCLRALRYLTELTYLSIDTAGQKANHSYRSLKLIVFCRDQWTLLEGGANTTGQITGDQTQKRQRSCL
jgi:hypothetical protein